MIRALTGVAMLGWELGVDGMKHWPPVFIFAFWLLGGPIEEMVKFATAGRIQVSVRKEKEPDDD